MYRAQLQSVEGAQSVRRRRTATKIQREEMSARGKRKDDDEHASEGDAPPKKTSKKDSDETDEIVVCEVFLPFLNSLCS